MSEFRPAYIHLLESQELEQRVALAYQCMEACCLCGWRCSKNRLEGKLGVCRTGVQARLANYGPHLGEEDPLRGWRGSGTIFFSRCNLRCQFCQNHDISQADTGEPVEPAEIAAIMLELQRRGCHNINLVSPTHVVPQILAAVLLAAKAGLRLPLVYNTGGYDSLKALSLLDGVVDIYMPDMKYSNPQVALRYSKVRDYPKVNQAAVREMHRQVGDLQINAHGLAERGLLVRHLVLPHNLAGTNEVVRFLAEEISTNTYLNLMDQYRPVFQARFHVHLNRRITSQEYEYALDLARAAGLQRLDWRRVIPPLVI
jgi:putative pyruvate formate lyase activating enzyme